MLLDELVPRWDSRERHDRPAAAPPAALLVAARAVTWREVPILRAPSTTGPAAGGGR